jgi:hypothetical protein
MLHTTSRLAAELDVKVATVSRWLNRKRRISARDAARLERFTGVPRLAWLYPDEYNNPYFNGNNVPSPAAQPEKVASTAHATR